MARNLLTHRVLPFLGSVVFLLSLAMAAPAPADAADSALQFDGTNDYVTFGTASGLDAQDFTLECWFYWTGSGATTSTGTGGLNQVIPLVTKGRGEEDGNSKDMNYFLGISEGKLAADFESYSGGTYPGGGTFAAGQNFPVTGTTTITTNTWHHAAATYDGACWHLYLDGSAERITSPVTTCPGLAPRYDSIQHAGIATAMTSTGAAAGFFNGIIDEVRIWSVARTQKEILENIDREITSGTGLLGRWGLNEGSGTTAGNSVSGGVDGTLTNGPLWVSPGGPLPPTSAPTAPSELSVRAIWDSEIQLTWTDNSDNEAYFEIERSTNGSGGPFSSLAAVAFNTTSYADPDVLSGEQYCYQVRARNSFGDSLYTAPPQCATTAAESNPALDFGKEAGYVTFKPTSVLGLPQFTIECWFKRSGPGSSAYTGSTGFHGIPLVTKGVAQADGSNLDMNYFLGIEESGNVLAADFEEGAGGSTPGLNHPVYGTTVIADNTWYHATATYDGSKWQLFLNGELEAELIVNQPPRSDSIQYAGLGVALDSGGTASGHFEGVMDEVRIWNYARTQQEIQCTIDTRMTEPQTGLVARWGLDEGTGTAVNSSAATPVTGTILGSGWNWVTGALFDLPVHMEGDFDCDCDVDGSDLQVFSDAMTTYNSAADFNGDMVVDEIDLEDFAVNYGAASMCP
jgi:hypothetical protein